MDILNDTADYVAKLPPVLIVDDDQGQRSLLSSFLRSQGFKTIPVASGEEALNILNSQDIALMISDVRMPGLSGLETLRRTRKEHSVLPVLLVTAYADIRDAVNAMRDGAVNYLEKPIDFDELMASVRNVIGLEPSRRLTYAGHKRLPDYVVAESDTMKQVFRDAGLVADSESRILITGESGVGKEIVAEVIHSWSPRAQGPFVKVNCAAIPEQLLESELFGHEKGAFTGAQNLRIGRFEEARNGTILLDEIAEMSPVLQAKLLSITQDGRFQRIGSNKEHQSNVRIIAATNRDLEAEVEKGSFREDLFFRLNVMEINVPPLRERVEDIIPLANQFAMRFAQSQVRFSSAVTTCLRNYSWPGNVRELQNAIERACLMSHGELIIPDHLPPRVRRAEGLNHIEEQSSIQRLENIELNAIVEALKQHRFNRTETAKSLGISRRSLINKLPKLRELGYHVDPPTSV